MGQPNLIIILIDDMGATDLGCTGSMFYETPCLDRFAAEGVRCTDGYAASPVCSPARSSVVTGKGPARTNVTNWIPGNAVGRMFGAPYNFHLAHEHRTIATALKEADYHTWHVGKWHLGGAAQQSLPTDHGFDVNIGGSHIGGVGWFPTSYYSPWVNPRGETLPGLENEPEGNYITDRLTDEAIRLITEKPDDKPFFLHLSHYAVHTPIVSPPELIARYEAKSRRLGLDQAQVLIEGEYNACLHMQDRRIIRRVQQSHAGYAAMVHNLDENTGRLMQALDEQGLGDDTFIVFVSDNGGLAVGNEGSVTCNLPFAEGKGYPEEGGVRVPLLWRWPNGIPGGRITRTPMWQCDIYPTFLAAAGMPQEPENHLDGVNVLDTLASDAPLDRDTIWWHYPHYPNQGATPSGAIRQGDWKLIEWFETGRVALYDLAHDVGECFDVAAQHPELTASLLQQLQELRAESGAKLPTPNPYYDDIIAGKIPRPDGLGNFPEGALPE